MNFFITGGNGLIGEKVCQLLDDKKNKVICFDNKPKIKNIRNKNISYFRGNILNKKDLNRALKKNKIDVFLHFAANLGVKKTEKNRLDCLNVNIDGTKNVLEACQKNKIPRIIFASSSEVYGDGYKKPIDEQYELMPKSSYGVSKITGESYVKAYSEKYGIKFNILRFFNVYGPNQREDFVISKFKNNIKKNKSIKIYGDGRQVRAFCHVEDAARAVIKVILKGKANDIYNVGNDNEPIKIINLAKKMIKQSKKRIKIIKVSFDKSDRTLSREIFTRCPKINKIIKHTKYYPSISLTDGIRSVLIDIK